MIKNILALTDFSHDAYNALFYATQLYKHQECTFHILHVYDNQSYFKQEYPGRQCGKSLPQFLNARATECLTETYHRIISDTEKNPLHQFVTIPCNDYLIKGVKTFMNNTPIDLIVMGNKGKTGAKEIFLGGNTMQMVKSNLSCPLLCVPREIDFKTISQIAFITDYKHGFRQHTLDVVKILALTYKASVHIIHITDNDAMPVSQEKNKEFLSRYFDDINLHFHIIPHEKSKAKTVARFVKEQGIDLLAMIYYRHYLLDKLFREPVILDLSIYLEIPLFILPDQD